MRSGGRAQMGSVRGAQRQDRKAASAVTGSAKEDVLDICGELAEVGASDGNEIGEGEASQDHSTSLTGHRRLAASSALRYVMMRRDGLPTAVSPR